MVKPIDLSEREREILRLVATGVSNKEIAHNLHISPNTVKVHLRNIFTKINVLSRTEATLYAMEHGIVDSPGNLELQASLEEAKRNLTSSKRRRIILPALVLVILSIIVTTWYLQQSRSSPTQSTQQLSSTATTQPRWQKHAPLPEGRAGMAAAVYENQIYIFAGETNAGITNTSLRYDIQADKWYPLANKPTAVTDIQAVMLGEKIYIPGGWSGSRAINTLEVYDPRIDAWEDKSPLPIALSGYALVALEGKLYLLGGWNGQKVTRDIYSYDPRDDKWTAMTPMPTARAFMGAVAMGNIILIVGGWDGTKNLSTIDEYSPLRNNSVDAQWIPYDTLPSPTCRQATAGISGTLIVMGSNIDNCPTKSGNSVSNLSTSSFYLSYMTQFLQWYLIDPPPQPVGLSPALVTINNFTYLIGGFRLNSYQISNYAYQAFFISSLPLLVSP